jgi:hypothetical protein
MSVVFGNPLHTAGKPYWRGKSSTVNLLVLTSLDQLIFILNIFLLMLQNKLPLWGGQLYYAFPLSIPCIQYKSPKTFYLNFWKVQSFAVMLSVILSAIMLSMGILEINWYIAYHPNVLIFIKFSNDQFLLYWENQLPASATRW